VSDKNKIACVAVAALFVVTNGPASGQHRGHNLPNLPRASKRMHGPVPRQVPLYDPTKDVYYSESLGHQSFPNPDRDFSIENLRSHPSN
jgi:hypothetical protein